RPTSTGLGLAIVAALVAAHHGTVEVAETPGGGATFRVKLPILPANPGLGSRPADRRQVDAPSDSPLS
ncbi:ATP-binding protein, partial [Micromonospora sp. SL1-18]|uniref:ATP-binding protein n=1 Tax=Micromonospora sp. SL1-18 TaxID=3399128 RepID=UPI003A4DC22F